MNKSIAMTVHVKAPLDKVWEGLTNPEMIKNYFFGTLVTTDWRVGSPIYFRGEYQGKPYEEKGHILECIPRSHVTYSYWSGFSGLPDLPEHYQRVTYTLKEHEDGTELTIRQENLKEDTEAHKAHVKENWSYVMNGLKSLLESSDNYQ